MPQRLVGRVSVVTGGGRGLGAAIGSRLVDEGARVAVADVNLEAAELVADGLRQRGPAIALQVDVTREDQVAAAVARVERELGELDLLVANAGILVSSDIAEFPLADWQRTLDVNLTGYFL